MVELSKTNPELLHAETSANFWAMPVRQDLEPWSDQRVRHAAMLAIDHQGIVDDFYGGNAEIVHKFDLQGAMSPLFYGTLEDLPADIRELFGYNPKKRNSSWPKPAIPMALTPR